MRYLVTRVFKHPDRDLKRATSSAHYALWLVTVLVQHSQIHHRATLRATHLGQRDERSDGRELLGSQRSGVCGEQSRVCLVMLASVRLWRAWGGSMARAQLLSRSWCRLLMLRRMNRLPRCCSRIAARLVVAVRARHVARGMMVASHGLWQGVAVVGWMRGGLWRRLCRRRAL